MYRDSATALDEHDRAVGAILISEALIDHCERAGVVLRDPATERHKRWGTLRDVQDMFPEIWRHLDRARDLVQNRGANTATFDEMRPHVRRAPTKAGGTEIDRAAFDETRRAVEALKLATPGADWKAIQERTAGLIKAPLPRSRSSRALVASGAFLGTVALASWGIGMIPAKKPDPRVVMRKELSETSMERKARIEEIRFQLGVNCEVAPAREMTKLLALDGRVPEARAFGESYLARCPDDESVDNWAHAPDRNQVATAYSWAHEHGANGKKKNSEKKMLVAMPTIAIPASIADAAR